MGEGWGRESSAESWVGEVGRVRSGVTFTRAHGGIEAF